MVFSVGRVVCTKILPVLPVWCSVWGGWSVLKYYLYYLYGVQCGEGGLCTKILPILPVWCQCGEGGLY